MIPLATVDTTVFLGVVGGMFTVFGGVIVALIGFRTNRQNTAVAFLGETLGRLAKVESDLKALQDQLTMSQRAVIAAVRFIDRLVAWGKDGGQEKMPTPPKDLHEYLDPDMWGEAQRVDES